MDITDLFWYASKFAIKHRQLSDSLINYWSTFINRTFSLNDTMGLQGRSQSKQYSTYSKHGDNNYHWKFWLYKHGWYWNSWVWPLTRYAKLWFVHAPEMPGTFSPPPWVSDPDMHHGTCVTHVPWCMPGSLTRGFLWTHWREKRSRHSRRMRNPQFCVSG